MRTLCLIAAIFATACAGGERRTASARLDPAEVVPCRADVPAAAETAWHEVRADGFTFCVPVTWRPTGSHTWRGGGHRVTWNMGEYWPQRRMAVAVVPSDRMPPTLPAQMPGTTSRRFRERIGGELVDLWESEVEGRFRAGAEWSEPRAMHMGGETQSQAGVLLLLDVYRTVRFDD